MLTKARLGLKRIGGSVEEVAIHRAKSPVLTKASESIWKGHECPKGIDATDVDIQPASSRLSMWLAPGFSRVFRGTTQPQLKRPLGCFLEKIREKLLKNKKVIVINGFARGGTTILWNIIQSHPQVCAPMMEVTECLVPVQSGVIRRGINLTLGNRVTRLPPLRGLAGNFLDSRFQKFKLKRLEDPDSKEKFEGVPYTQKEIEDCVLCLKGVNQDIYLSDLLNDIYPECYFIGLVRNGYALCEGWCRRGKTATTAGRAYSKLIHKMMEDSKRFKQYRIMRFEDILQDPFGVAEEIFQFARLEPTRLEKIKLPSLKVLSKNGQHQSHYGTEKRKYWFSRETIGELLNPDISAVQSEALAPDDKAAFEKEAKALLDHFHYQ